MPKPVTNSRIDYQNSNGRVNQHDLWLNQAVLSGSSPTFANLRLTGDATIEGNLYVDGNTTIINTAITEFEDNILLLNNQETGSGVTLNQGGIEIDRGTLTNYRIVYDETTATTRVGQVGVISPGNVNPFQAVVVREDAPLTSGVMVWNNTNKRIDSTNTVVIPLTLTSTVNSTNVSNGTLVINGGVGISKNLSINGNINLGNTSNTTSSTIQSSTGSLTLSTSALNLNANTDINVPVNIPIKFGGNTQQIKADTSGNLSISAGSTLRLTPTVAVSIPNQIPLIFSTVNEKVYTDSSNNMIVAGSQDVLLSPGNGIGGRVLIPVNVPVTFSNNNQQITANTNNDLTVNAGNNILLNPGTGTGNNVRIPTGNGLKFGATGNQVISANSNNQLTVTSTQDISLIPGSGFSINISTGTLLTLGAVNAISGSSSGILSITANNYIQATSQLYNSSTLESFSATTGSIRTDGGLGVAKTITTDSGVVINSTSANALTIKNGATTFINVDSSTITGKVSVTTGDGTNNAASVSINSNSSLYGYSLMSLKSTYDTVSNYLIGRGTSTFNTGRVMTMNIPSHTDYGSSGAKPKFSVTTDNSTKELFSIETDTGNLYTLGVFSQLSTENSTSSTTGAIIVYGGLGVVKDVFVTGKINDSVDSVSALSINGATGDNVFNVDTISKVITANSNIIVNSTNSNAVNINGNVIINTLLNKLTTNLTNVIVNTTNSVDTSSGAMIVSGGVAVHKNFNVGGSSSFAASIDMLNNKIVNLANPDYPQEAATKAYVDLIKQGLYVKDSVTVATTTSGNLATDFVVGTVIDTYTLQEFDRILIKDQSNQIENGLYNVTNSTPTRTIDLAENSSASGIFCFVKNGAVNSGLGWICNTPSYSDNVGSMPLNFTEFTGLGQVQAGDGLSKNFNELNVVVDNISIEIIADALRIKDTALSTGLTGGSGSPLQTTTDQSHVTQLGTINTGTWQGSVVQVPYGGTGSNKFTLGNLLFGNGSSAISTDTKLFYDRTNVRLGLGTSAPTKDFHIKNSNTITLLLDADTDGNNSNAYPELVFSYSGNQKSTIGMTRNYNQYASNIYSNAFVISNDQIDTTSIIQLATNQVSRLTVLSNGNIGIATSAPGYTLDINGTFKTNGIVTFANNTSSLNSSTGVLIMSGGVSINNNVNSTSITRGGSLTIAGGAAVSQDLYIGGSLYAVKNTSNLYKLNIVSTDPTTSSTTGALFVSGGLSIQNTSDAVNISNGGALIISGGASIVKNMYVGSTLNALTDAYLGGMYFTSTENNNFVMTPDNPRIIDSFTPINFTRYNNTNSNIVTIHGTGLVLNDSSTLKIGGTLVSPDGYSINFTNGNLNVISDVSGYTIKVEQSDLNVNGNTGYIAWKSLQSKLQIMNSSIELSNTQGKSIVITSPNSSGVSYIIPNSVNGTINLGQNTTGSQLTTVLSNNLGNSSVIFTPSTTSSNLNLTSNVITNFSGPVNALGVVNFSGNAMHSTITNTSGSALWIYLGQVSGYAEIDFNGNGGNGMSSGLKLIASVTSGNCNTSHYHYGSTAFDNVNKVASYVFKDTLSQFQLYTLVPSNSETNINVLVSSTPLSISFEGTSTVPNGTTSGYIGSWTQEYSTRIESTLQFTFGDVTMEGYTKTADNLPIIGYNNELVTGSRDLGILLQRYQQPNDAGLGDIVNDISPAYIDSIPTQELGPASYQLKLSNLASSVDDYYTGWWVRVYTGANVGQVREITSYNGTQRVATLSTPFTTSNPSLGDTVYLYNNTLIANYYDHVNNTFSLSFTDKKSSQVNVNNNADLRLSKLYSTDTTTSTGVTTGSIYTLGSIAISGTSNCVSSTNGGTLTSAGGAGIAKNLIVGMNIGVGSGQYTPLESIHIRKLNATMRLENDASQFSYVDYVENGTSQRYGTLVNNSQFSITYNSSSNTPDLANKALTINASGFVGINTTHNNSPLTILGDNFISINNTTGYLGLTAADTNTVDSSLGSSIIMYSNGVSASAGSVVLHSGTNTGGNIKMYNGEVLAMNIDSVGITSINSTKHTTNSTTGAFIVFGGMGIASTQNSSNTSSGGALTVNGGVSINKDLYLGGDLFISGALNAAGSVTSPATTFSSPINCTFNSSNNNKLMTVGGSGVFTLAFDVLPSTSSSNCEIQFSLPGKSNALLYRTEVITNVTGYTDDTNVIPLFNVLGFGVTGSTNVSVKFQSSSLDLHYFQVTCNYSLD
jgi:hypothetical protein